ncbi:MAG: folate-binding protein YgfZ [Legionellales bacterium]|jgi:tRNA-modifying protein YgfZ|nr:folate-binding protein YgfZ [Legionellales bacterium]
MSIIISPLTSFGCLKISGKEVRNFIQGQLTCNIDEISENRLSLAAYCNDKGRISASGYIIMLEGEYFFLTPKNLLAHTEQKFKQYAIFSNIIVKQTNEILAVACINTPNNIDLPTIDSQVNNIEPGVKAACINSDNNLFLFFGKMANMIEFQDKINSQKDVDLMLDMHHWEQANINSGIVHIHPETLEKLTPHMINYHKTSAVSFEKGCYLGQEIIARTEHRGRSKRKLYKCEINNNNSVAIGENITTKSGEQAGMIVALGSVEKDKSHALLVLADHTISSSLFVQNTSIENLTVVAQPEAATQ